ncbi:hypothetical protein [Aridibaculum aurantiacum]|uniref:hypothetical protein n=1 Tax=Aridibaculum aurantiacum TaxID=2810307 RepID=UPI001F600BBC|nr:hypothetical protein [Aridibaculum aurantiacum]
MLYKVRSKFRRFFGNYRQFHTVGKQIAAVQREVNVVKELVAKQQVAHIRSLGIVDDLKEVEFKVYSQAGEDGIIQYLVNNIQGMPPTFVEFGVENYREANTRFLLTNNNWSGLVIDGSDKNVEQIKSDEFYIRFDLYAAAKFITAENINSIISEHGFNGEIGLLSVDVDGNDYWIWNAIDVVNPVIVVCEYNSVFGNQRAISIPYEPDFYLKDAHYSHLHFGASLPAMIHLATQKGYSYVGSNTNGSNAFFVRNDKVGQLKVHTSASSFVDSKFRSSRDAEGRLTFVSGFKRKELIKDMPVVNVVTGAMETVGDHV